MNKQYKAISDSTVRIDKTINIDEEHDERMKYIQKTENMMTTVRAYIEKIKDYAEFKFDFTLDIWESEGPVNLGKEIKVTSDLIRFLVSVSSTEHGFYTPEHAKLIEEWKQKNTMTT